MSSSAMNSSAADAERGHRLHIGIAEQGKLLALRGRHAEALAHYREALRMAHARGAPQVIGRHYLHCVLESLEHMGAFDAMIALCDEALACVPEAAQGEFQRRDRAHLLERRAVAELKAGQAGARAGFERAIAAAGSGVLPLSEQLLAWLVRGYALAAARITDAQRRHGYFVVREGQVDAQRAIPLPSIPASAAAPSSPSSIHRGGVRG